MDIFPCWRLANSVFAWCHPAIGKSHTAIRALNTALLPWALAASPALAFACPLAEALSPPPPTTPTIHLHPQPWPCLVLSSPFSSPSIWSLSLPPAPCWGRGLPVPCRALPCADFVFPWQELPFSEHSGAILLLGRHLQMSYRTSQTQCSQL